MATRRTTTVPAGMPERFARWVQSQGLDQATADDVAARKLGCSVHMVRALRRAQRSPGLSLAFAIESATRGRIKAREWVGAGEQEAA